MSRETNFHALILKKQHFGEADELITFYTKETGKVRGLAKSIRLQKSKLQSFLQALFYVEITLAKSRTASGIKKIIKAQTLETFSNIRGNLPALKAVFFVLEAVLKGTPDEHKNEKLFNLLLNFLTYCNQKKLAHEFLEIALVKFNIMFLETIGLKVREPQGKQGKNYYFSNFKGGWTTSNNVSDAIRIEPEIFKQFLEIKQAEFLKIGNLHFHDIKILKNLVTHFLEYQLEREMKAKKYLNAEM